MSYVSDDLNAEFIDTFKMLDPRDTGSITGTQLGLALKVHGIESADPKLQEMISQSSKSISFSEYIAIVLTHLSTDSWCRHEIQEVFDVFDKEGVGNLTPQQMKRVAIRLGEKLNDEEIEQQFLQFDTNDELKVEPRGFASLILSNDEIVSPK
jgi:Ca2+-binding EF-hand superfamily protein